MYVYNPGDKKFQLSVGTDYCTSSGNALLRNYHYITTRPNI